MNEVVDRHSQVAALLQSLATRFRNEGWEVTIKWRVVAGIDVGEMILVWSNDHQESRSQRHPKPRGGP